MCKYNIIYKALSAICHVNKLPLTMYSIFVYCHIAAGKNVLIVIYIIMSANKFSA